MIDEPSMPQAPRRTEPVPGVSESDLWLAELLLLSNTDRSVRSAQFVIRTAVRAEQLAKKAGTTAIDELLDARGFATSARTRTIYDRAICYLRAELMLSAGMRGGEGPRRLSAG
jgi:hypothetical protein